MENEKFAANLIYEMRLATADMLTLCIYKR